MFESSGSTAAQLAAMIGALQHLQRDIDDAERVDQLRLLEELKAVASAAQALTTAAFVASQQAKAVAAGAAADQTRRTVARQVGLARRISPHRAQREVSWAGILTTDLPDTFAALAAGRISEWRAILVAREAAWLSKEDRVALDAELAPRLESLGDRGVEREARRIAYRLDPVGAVGRFRSAEQDRRVTLRPGADTMAVLTAVLPVAQGVACYAALVREAQSRIAQGDPRTGGQLMADTLVARVTGQNTAEGVPVEVNVVMTDAALFGVGCEAAEPAIVEGFGPIPAEVARELVRAPGSSVPRWTRRLYRHPASGELVALDARRRKFTKGQRRFIRLRDQCCRTPWCEAPIRHFDHIVPSGRGGPTAVVNGEGYCAACNLAKDAPGWSARVEQSPHGRHRVVLTTPTGHEYASEPPPLPGASLIDRADGQVA